MDSINLIKLVEENPSVALGVGLIIGLYILGKADNSDSDQQISKMVKVSFEDEEDELEYLERRVKEIKRIRKSEYTRDVMIHELQKEVDKLKHQIEDHEIKNH